MRVKNVKQFDAFRIIIFCVLTLVLRVSELQEVLANKIYHMALEM